jgi:hypothetical protein
LLGAFGEWRALFAALLRSAAVLIASFVRWAGRTALLTAASWGVTGADRSTTFTSNGPEFALAARVTTAIAATKAAVPATT